MTQYTINSDSLQWQLFREPTICHMFIYLLLRMDMVEPDTNGERFLQTTLENISLGTGIKWPTAKATLKRLAAMGYISIDTSTYKYHTIKILKTADEYGNQLMVGRPSAKARKEA